MIQNENQLALTREQLGRLERALDALRCEVKPKSEEWYAVMADGCIDMMLRLRAEIDTYIGIDDYHAREAAYEAEKHPRPAALPAPAAEPTLTPAS